MSYKQNDEIVELVDVYSTYCDLVDNGPIDEVISFAKQYNIFQVSRSSVYTNLCNKIKARLDREGLPYETVRPE
jgi:hypothetical protein